MIHGVHRNSNGDDDYRRDIADRIAEQGVS